MSSDEEKFNEFLASLSDAQTGIFYGNLQNPNLWDIMMDQLKIKQYDLMEKAERAIVMQGGPAKPSANEDEEAEASQEVEISESTEDEVDYADEDDGEEYTNETDPEENIAELEDKRRKLSESLPSNLRILLLGEAGVGKSTMINAFANYMQYLSYAKAKTRDSKDELKVLVPGSFSLLDEQMNNIVFNLEPNMPSGPSPLSENYSSLTSCELPILEKSITFIDTPGFGSDSDASESEFEVALNYANEEKPEAILILLQPGLARLTSMLEIFLSKVLRSCDQDKVYFCFTSSQSTMYRPGETFSTLRSFLQRNSLEIEKLIDKTFCFENEAFKFLRLMEEKDFKLYEYQMRSLAKSWSHSTETMFNLLNAIASSHIVEPTPAPEPIPEPPMEVLAVNVVPVNPSNKPPAPTPPVREPDNDNQLDNPSPYSSGPNPNTQGSLGKPGKKTKNYHEPSTPGTRPEKRREVPVDVPPQSQGTNSHYRPRENENVQSPKTTKGKKNRNINGTSGANSNCATSNGQPKNQIRLEITDDSANGSVDNQPAEIDDDSIHRTVSDGSLMDNTSEDLEQLLDPQAFHRSYSSIEGSEPTPKKEEETQEELDESSRITKLWRRMQPNRRSKFYCLCVSSMCCCGVPLMLFILLNVYKYVMRKFFSDCDDCQHPL